MTYLESNMLSAPDSHALVLACLAVPAPLAQPMNGAFPLRSVVPVQELSASMLLLHGMPEGSPHSYDQMAGVAEGQHNEAHMGTQLY